MSVMDIDFGTVLTVLYLNIFIVFIFLRIHNRFDISVVTETDIEGETTLQIITVTDLAPQTIVFIVTVTDTTRPIADTEIQVTTVVIETKDETGEEEVTVTEDGPHTLPNPAG